MNLDYTKHRIKNLVSINKIVSIHYYELGKNFSFDGESHNFWEMVYADVGEVEITANGKSVCLKQGEIIFHKPNEFHTLKSNNETASNVFVISFVCSSKNMNFFKDKIIPIPKKLKKNIYAIIEEYNLTFNYMAVEDKKLVIQENAIIGGQQMIRTHLEQLLIMLIRNEEENRKSKIFPSEELSDDQPVSRIINIIEENIYGRISVKDICDKLNYSTAYLSKIFKSQTGYTILEYMLMRKIKEAKKMIREEKYNFTQISNILCFDNPHYFTTVFKRITNMTPGDYKKSVLNL